MDRTVKVVDNLLHQFVYMDQYSHNKLFCIKCEYWTLKDLLKDSTTCKTVEDIMNYRNQCGNLLKIMSDMINNYNDLFESISFALCFSQDECDIHIDDLKTPRQLAELKNESFKLYNDIYKTLMIQPLGLLTKEEYEKIIEERRESVYLNLYEDLDGNVDHIEKQDEKPDSSNSKGYGCNII